MITKIIKQVWNQRRTNGWIFLEVIIAGLFLWTVIDPVYVLTVNTLEDKGYEEEGRYVLQLGSYGANHGMRDTTVTNSIRKEAFYRFIQLIQEQPEVESVYTCLYNSMPNAGGWSGAEFRPDTLARPEEKITHTQHYQILTHQGCDIFRTLGMKDVLTGNELVMPEEAASRNLCFVSEQFAQKMFGTTQVIGQKIFDYKNNPMEIGGVFQNMKTRDYHASYPLVISFEKDFYAHDYVHRSVFLIFRLKEGVDFEAFNERFKKEVAPHMSQGNFYFNSLSRLPICVMI